jgi:hypothetical protein
MPLIETAGAYPGIDADDYHGNPDLLPGPSLSSSGAKTILDWSPFHFWASSPLNPDRPEEDEKPHFAVGRAAHDVLLLEDRWADFYHVLPEGYSAAHTKKWAAEICEHEAAREAGKTVLRHQDAEIVTRVAAALRANPVAMNALRNGVPEVTLAWQDAETGAWLRARPDFLPNSVVRGAALRAVPDLKFMSPTYCKPRGFQKAIADFGYHISAAFYAEGIAQVYGKPPTNWLHIVAEKDFPFTVSLYELPAEDIERGAFLMRKAVRTFADCLAADRWPSWADEPQSIGLPHWSRKMIDEYGTATDAALTTA